MTDNLDIVMMVAGLFGLMLGLVTGMKKRGNRKGPYCLQASKQSLPFAENTEGCQRLIDAPGLSILSSNFDIKSSRSIVAIGKYFICINGSNR